MRFDFSIASAPAAALPLALRTIYTIFADPTYDVSKAGVGNDDLVALRTLGGRGSVQIEGMAELMVIPDTLLLFRHEEVRRYRCYDESWDFWWFEFAADSGLDLPLNTILPIAGSEIEIDYFKKALDLLKEDTPASRAAASAIAGVLIYEWKHHLSHASSNHGLYAASVGNLINHLRTEPSSGISLAQMAEKVGLCERRFRQVFKDITGQSPKKYLESLRMRLAEDLLKNTTFSIEDISYRLGYSSQFHFSREFHKIHGIPPSRYRSLVVHSSGRSLQDDIKASRP